MEIKKLFDYKETANYLNVSVRTVQRWASIGRLPVVRFSKRTVKIPVNKLNSLIESGGIIVSYKEVKS